MRLGLIVPFYNHEHAIRQTVAALKPHGFECWLVDDGSAERCGRDDSDHTLSRHGGVILSGYPIHQA